MTVPNSSSATGNYAGRPRLGRYVLVREIARSNDIVWEAADPHMGRRVAVKELSLPPTLTGQARRERIERFYREARAAGAMSHPNIVTIYEVGEDDGRYFIAMEYLEGQTLRDRLATTGALPLSEAVRITSALCDALAYAHAHGVIHRDIKPDNVHLLPDGGVKLTDFGIARITHEESLTMDGQVFGTPSYMSPEQIMGRAIDVRSDIFSLGILLCEMLSGRKPFSGDSVVTITYRILHDELPALPGVSPAVSAVIQRAASKEPTARFASAVELRAALVTAVAAGQNAPAAALAGPPAALAGGPPQTTVGYSARTQLGASPYGAAPAPPVAAAPDRFDGLMDRPSPGSRALVATLTALVVLGILAGGGWVVSRAFVNYAAQARADQEKARLGAAMRLFERGQFEQAADAFHRLRDSPSTEVRARAPLYESYCYRSLGNRMIRTDLAEAERLFRLAFGSASEAVRRAPSDRDAQAEYTQARSQLGDVLRARGGAPAGAPTSASGSAAPPPPGVNSAPSGLPALDGMTPRPGGATGPNNASVPDANALQNSTQAQWNQAQQHLQSGDEAWKRGDEDQALRSWGLAVQTGPGSPAATTAQDRLNRYNGGTPPLPPP
jgi:serine/threonine-protein kinase